jgi:hypothetical protein
MGHGDVAITMGFPWAGLAGRERSRPREQRFGAGALGHCASGQFPPEREPTVRAPSPRGALPRRSSNRSPEGARPSVLRFRTSALRRCPFNRFPGGPRPSVQRVPGGCPSPPRFQPRPRRISTVHATGRGECPSPLPFGPIPLRHRCRRRKRLVCPTLGGCANPRRARCRDILVAPSAHHLRCLLGAELAPHTGLATPADSARVASDPHRALEATGCHGLSSPSTLACARAATPTRVPVRTDEDAGSSSEEPAPNRGAHGRATCIRAARTLYPTARVIDVAADGDPARSLGGDHLRGSVQYGTLRDALGVVMRCSTRHGAANPLRTSPARRQNTSGGAQPTAGIESPLRGPLTTHLVELLGGVATSSLSVPRIARQLTPHLKSRTTNGDPKATIARRDPRLGADAQWPPCGDPPTPELTHSPGTPTPD